MTLWNFSNLAISENISILKHTLGYHVTLVHLNNKKLLSQGFLLKPFILQYDQLSHDLSLLKTITDQEESMFPITWSHPILEFKERTTQQKYMNILNICSLNILTDHLVVVIVLLLWNLVLSIVKLQSRILVWIISVHKPDYLPVKKKF